MTAIEIMNGRPESGGYKVDVSRGGHNGRVSSEWFSRPDDEKYLSLSDLYASVKGRAERSKTRTVESTAIRVEAHRDDPEKLALVLPDAEAPVAPTHWSFGQLASLVSAPAAYLRRLPAPLAGINLQYGLTNHRAEQVKTMEVANGRTELRAVSREQFVRPVDCSAVLQREDEDRGEPQPATGGENRDGLAGQTHDAGWIGAEPELFGDVAFRTRLLRLTMPGPALLGFICHLDSLFWRRGAIGPRRTPSARTMRTVCWFLPPRRSSAAANKRSTMSMLRCTRVLAISVPPSAPITKSGGMSPCTIPRGKTM